ncbi:hypothetical protein HZS_1478 [Henneguya salminicola]|nr:hypothetical protein HZS_1478 [Henneguya salminicola]
METTSNTPKRLSNALCDYCDHHFKEFYLKELNQLNFYQKRCNLLWTECQRCQGSFLDEIICTNRDCPIFYMRTKALKDVKSQQQLLKRFEYINN